MISGSLDSTIKVWNINNNTLSHIKTFEGHKNYVRQVIPLTNNIIVSGSDDYTIKIWDINAYKEIFSLKENFSVWSYLN